MGEFSLKLHITVECATGLCNPHGFGGTSDPYCICEVAHLQRHTRYQKFSTPVIKNDLNPAWNYESDIDVIPGQSLEFQVWDRRLPLQDILLGKALLHSNQINTVSQNELQLTGEGVSGSLTVKVVPPVPFKVHIEGARDLYNADGIFAGVSDPYCICQVAGLRRYWKSTRFRTQTVDNNLNPIWNHTQDVFCTHGQSLEFQVWDSNTKPLPDQLLGQALLDSAQLLPNGYQGNLPLHGKNATGHICLRIVVQPPEMLQSLLPVRLTAGMDGSLLHQYIENHEQKEKIDDISAGSELDLKVQVVVRSASYLGDTVHNPYCICQVSGLPRYTRYQQFQTRPVKKDQSPVWDHTGDISMHAGQDLTFQVWDKRGLPMPDHMIGEVLVPHDRFLKDGFAGRELRLSGSHGSGLLTVEIHPPRLYLITIVSGSELANSNGIVSGISDPYCICQVAGQWRHSKKGTRFQTRIVENNLNPMWNHSSEICLAHDQSIEFQVWDSNTKPLPDHLMGVASLEGTRLRSGENSFDLQLTGRGATGSIKVKVASVSSNMNTLPEALAIKIELMAQAGVRWCVAQLRRSGEDADIAHADMDQARHELAELGVWDAATCHQIFDMGLCSCALTVAQSMELANIGELREDFQHAHDSQHRGIGFMLWRQLEELFAVGARLACAETKGDVATTTFFKADFERRLMAISGRR